MKTLLAFWHWYETERPAQPINLEFFYARLRHHESASIEWALDAVNKRRGYRLGITEMLAKYGPVIKDMSIAACAAYERMREAVPNSGTVTVLDCECNECVRELAPKP